MKADLFFRCLVELTLAPLPKKEFANATSHALGVVDALLLTSCHVSNLQ